MILTTVVGGHRVDYTLEFSYAPPGFVRLRARSGLRPRGARRWSLCRLFVGRLPRKVDRADVEALGVGLVYCSLRDAFVRRTGRELALAAALRDASVRSAAALREARRLSASSGFVDMSAFEREHGVHARSVFDHVRRAALSAAYARATAAPSTRDVRDLLARMVDYASSGASSSPPGARVVERPPGARVVERWVGEFRRVGFFPTAESPPTGALRRLDAVMKIGVLELTRAGEILAERT